MATTFMDKQANALIKKLHILTGKAGMNDEAYRAFLWDNYKVTSSKDMNVYELTEACGKLDKLADPKLAEIDVWRKRVLASVLSYLRAMGMEEDMNKAKGIAARAAKAEYFNAIKVDQLRNIYSAFNRKVSDATSVEEVTREMITNLKNNN